MYCKQQSRMEMITLKASVFSFLNFDLTKLYFGTFSAFKTFFEIFEF